MESGHKSSQKKNNKQKFIDAARDIGCDEDEARFDANLRKIGTAKPLDSSDPQKTKPKDTVEK